MLAGVVGVVVIGLAILLGWLAGGSASTTPVPGQTVMRYGSVMRGVGLVGVLAAVLIVVVFGVRLILGYDSPDFAIFPVSLAAFFLLLSAPMLLIGFRTAVVVDDTGLTFRNMFGGSTHIPWDEVEHISYSPSAGGFLVHAGGGKRKVAFHLPGRDVFIAECKRRLTRDQIGDVFDRPLPPVLF